MNFILKIIQGPNVGAEIALVPGTTVSFGRGEACDIVLGDQMLPEKAGELAVEDNRVSLRLPDGGEEALAPFQVKVMETTAFAIGPADAPWGALVWPKPEAEKTEETEEKKETPPPSAEEKPAEKPPRVPRRLQWTLLVLLLLVVVLEFAIWLFWPQFNDGMRRARTWCHGFYERHFEDKRVLAAKPVHLQTLKELATAYGVEAVEPSGDTMEPPVLRGNLRSRADRLQLTARAYNAFPGIEISLSDDESLRNSAEELLNMLTEGAVKVVEAADRRLALAGTLPDAAALHRMLKAIQADVAFVESVDCKQITIPAAVAPPQPVVVQPAATAAGSAETEPATPPPAPAMATQRLPIVGVLMTPYPCLVMRNGTRVVEGAEFNGFTVDKITEDTVVLRQGETVLEWKP